MTDDGPAPRPDEGISTRQLGCFIVLAAVIVAIARSVRRRRRSTD
ncbi:MAG TPA: hypothetical protein VH813_01670 [Candidatus Limnocylindrales bacterium]|jgi:hypothetical protein